MPPFAGPCASPPPLASTVASRGGSLKVVGDDTKGVGTSMVNIVLVGNRAAVVFVDDPVNAYRFTGNLCVRIALAFPRPGSQPQTTSAHLFSPSP